MQQQRQRERSMRRVCAGLLGLTLVVCTQAAAAPATVEEWDSNDSLRTLLAGLIVYHDLMIPLGLVPEPVINTAAETIEASTNILLKAFPPVFEPPPDVGPLMPNSPDQCTYAFVAPQPEAEF
jgi:hypothetical protein